MKHNLKFPVQTVQRSPDGFTMVELLVVIGIIALLTTLAVMAIAPSLENAKTAATKATINQVNEVIQQRLDAIQQMDVSVEAKKLATLNSSISEKQAAAFIRTNLYRQALPQRLRDLSGIDGHDDSGAANSDDAPLRSLFTLTDINQNEEYQSSALLYLALTQGSQLRVLPYGKSYRVPTLDTDSLNQKHVAQIAFDSSQPNATSTAFVDAWGKPLRFYNFPTQIIQDTTNRKSLFSNLPANILTDPMDPFQTLGSSALASGGTLLYSPPSSSLNAQAFNVANYHDINKYYTPLLISSGPDQSLGVYEPYSTPPNHLCVVETQADIYDNITNRQQ